MQTQDRIDSEREGLFLEEGIEIEESVSGDRGGEQVDLMSWVFVTVFYFCVLDLMEERLD